jgi:hypothetical protein
MSIPRKFIHNYQNSTKPARFLKPFNKILETISKARFGTGRGCARYGFARWQMLHSCTQAHDIDLSTFFYAWRKMILDQQVTERSTKKNEITAQSFCNTSTTASRSCRWRAVSASLLQALDREKSPRERGVTNHRNPWPYPEGRRHRRANLHHRPPQLHIPPDPSPSHSFLISGCFHLMLHVKDLLLERVKHNWPFTWKDEMGNCTTLQKVFCS